MLYCPPSLKSFNKIQDKGTLSFNINVTKYLHVNHFFFSFSNQCRILGFITVLHELSLVLNGEVYELLDSSVLGTLVLESMLHYQNRLFKVKNIDLYIRVHTQGRHRLKLKAAVTKLGESFWSPESLQH